MTLREYLQQNDMSYRQFARLVNRNHTTVLRWITGETEIGLRDAYRVLVITDGKVCPHDVVEEYEIRENIH